MGNFYCKKHKRVSHGVRDAIAHATELTCGCNLTDKEAEENRLNRKFVFTFKDGRELYKKEAEWLIKNG